MKEIKVYVNRRPGHDLMEIYIVERVGMEIYNWNTTLRGELRKTKVNEIQDNAKPFMQVPGFLWNDLVKAMSNDMPNMPRDVMEGQLESTKYHLEDMRKLVFKSNQSHIKN